MSKEIIPRQSGKESSAPELGEVNLWDALCMPLRELAFTELGEPIIIPSVLSRESLSALFQMDTLRASWLQKFTEKKGHYHVDVLGDDMRRMTDVGDNGLTIEVTSPGQEMRVSYNADSHGVTYTVGQKDHEQKFSLHLGKESYTLVMENVTTHIDSNDDMRISGKFFDGENPDVTVTLERGGTPTSSAPHQ